MWPPIETTWRWLAVALTLGAASLPSAVGHAQLRVEAFESTVTASGPPMSAWFTVHNDGERALRLEVRSLTYVPIEGSPIPLRVEGLEVDGAARSGPIVVPPHRDVRLVVLVEGFPMEPQRERYEMRVTLCAGSTGPCAEGRTVVQRAYRDPIRH
jgi:hypothetical protein